MRTSTSPTIPRHIASDATGDLAKLPAGLVLHRQKMADTPLHAGKNLPMPPSSLDQIKLNHLI